MKKSNEIRPRASLGQYPQIAVVVLQILKAAAAGSNRPEADVERVYTAIMSGLDELRGDKFFEFRDELVRILGSPDRLLEEADNLRIDKDDWRNHK